jgi:endoglucanase
VRLPRLKSVVDWMRRPTFCLDRRNLSVGSTTRVRHVAWLIGLACGCLAACGGTTPSPPPSPSPGPNAAPYSAYPAGCPGQEPHSPTTAPTVAVPAQVQPPLHAQLAPGAASPALVDDHGRLVKLVGVNWYGAESPDLVPGGLDKHSPTQIAREIKALHFNSVRLPFSNYIVECDPVVKPALIGAPATAQVHALEVYDQVVAALAREGLMVILDNHSSDPTWSPDSNDALWHNASYSTDQWIRDWIAMAQRYRRVPAVVGADLRNEPTKPAEWGTGGADHDWRGAAELAGNAVLSSSGNPNLLVMVEGIDLGVNLTGVAQEPICLQPGQSAAHSGAGACPPGTKSSSLVYAPHDYTESQGKDINKEYKELTNQLDNTDGWAAAAAAAPLWIGEFGTCNTTPRCVRADPNSAPPENCANTRYAGPVGTWFANFTDYVAQRNYSWAYWPLNGTQSTGGLSSSRDRSQTECYGLLDKSWSAPPPTAADLICALQSMISPSAATYPADGCAKGAPFPPVPTTGGAGPTAATVVKKFEPWVPVGQIGGFAPAPGLVVTNGGKAVCDSGSADDPGAASAVRCSPPGNGVPCFIYTGSGDPSNPLLCSSDPTSNQVTEVKPTGQGVPVGALNTDDSSQPAWFLVLADGRTCSLHGYGTNSSPLPYYCGGNVLTAMPDRSRPVWTVKEATDQANPTPSPTGVAVVTAYR